MTASSFAQGNLQTSKGMIIIRDEPLVGQTRGLTPSPSLGFATGTPTYSSGWLGLDLKTGVSFGLVWVGKLVSWVGFGVRKPILGQLLYYSSLCSCLSFASFPTSIICNLGFLFFKPLNFWWQAAYTAPSKPKALFTFEHAALITQIGRSGYTNSAVSDFISSNDISLNHISTVLGLIHSTPLYKSIVRHVEHSLNGQDTIYLS